ncbi:MAG: multidrug efflux RND transporter permease subunit [Pseudomonadota bacterium]
MLPQFFISRPKFAFVISILITIAGFISLTVLPVSEYPDISPPQVSVAATYSGATAEVIQETVGTPIETQVNGVDDMMYMSSTSSDSGSYSLSVTFEIGTDPDIAAVNVQNRVSLATSSLPSEVTAQGISVQKASTSILMIITVSSPNNTYDATFLSNYVDINIADALARVDGVGDASILGSQPYSMRIWLDPNKLAGFELTATDVILAIEDQNVQASAGSIGAPPAPSNQQFQYTIQTQGRLTDPDQFGDIIVAAFEDGSEVRIRDVARVELGSQYYTSFSNLDGNPTSALSIYQSPDANALNVANAVKAELEELSKRFPEDMEYNITYDTTRYVQATIDEVIETLLIAFVLVVFVTFVFLQNWRATLIPTLAIPVSLIGTFAVLYILGYSANTISLFALILAIGIVVDDAIIVVENVQRIMTDEGLERREATRKAMKQITGPVIATTLVLLAVFVPIGFMPGLSGRIYQQFAVTISVSVVISSINALTLSPALCASLLRSGTLTNKGPFGVFNRVFDKIRHGYTAVVVTLARRSIIGLVLLAGVFGGGYVLFNTIPTGFLPEEDRGAFFVNIELPDASSLTRTQVVVDQVQEILSGLDGVENVITIPGYSLLAGGTQSNGGFAVAVLKPWDERSDPTLSLQSIMGKAQGKLFGLSTASVFVFSPPPIPGLGTTGGMSLEVQDEGGNTPQALAQAVNALVYNANQRPELDNIFATFSANVPQVYVNLDRQKAEAMGVSVADVFIALQANMGSFYVNDFNYLSRVFQVIVQAESDYRSTVSDIGRIYVRSSNNDMIPLSTLIDVTTVLGPQQLNAYNLFRSASVNGQQAAGYSTGQALAVMEEVADEYLPQGFTFSWSGQSLQELEAAGKTTSLIIFAIVFVYLFLVAQYESWTMPFVVVLSVPTAALGALGLVLVVGSDINIYTQIGLVLLIGLASKNAILIAEFAKVRREEGAGIIDAASEAAKLRFRAILMTSFSFILGVVPLAIAVGAGAGSRRAMGNTVLGGMAAAVLIGIFLIPLLYVIVQRIVEWRRHEEPGKAKGSDKPEEAETTA